MRGQLAGFFEFIREQGVVGLAVGFVLGGAISKVVASLVSDVINPLLGVLLGFAGNLHDASFTIGEATVLWGSLVIALIDFTIIALVVYYGLKLIGIEHLTKK